MRQGERDELLERQTEAQEALVNLAQRRERRQERERLAEVPGATSPASRIFHSSNGLRLLLGIPGFASLWQTVVPDSYIERVRDRQGALCQIIRCPCGAGVLAAPQTCEECPGGCSRWYLSLPSTIRVKNFGQAAA